MPETRRTGHRRAASPARPSALFPRLPARGETINSGMRFEDFREEVPASLLPPLDRKDPGNDIVMTPDAAFWRENGYLILPRFLPDDLLEAYRRAFLAAGVSPGGFSGPQPFLQQPEMLDLCCHPPLVKKIEEVIPTPMGVTLGLTASISTTRT